MITEFYIDNFKSLADFKLSCHSLTCLIGLNNSGKTSILQAIDFLTAVLKGQARNWLDSRDWSPKDIKSQLKKGRQHTVNFRLKFDLNRKCYAWSGTFNLNTLSCTNETFVRTSPKVTVLLNVENNTYTVSEENKKPLDFDYEGSVLASLKEHLLHEELKEIKHFLYSIKSLELLNPLLLRKRARLSEGNLGIGGEKLSAFLYSLASEKKDKIYNQMHTLFETLDGYHVRAKRSGWKELWISEKFKDDSSNIFTEAKNISDGLLRILALFSQLQTDNAVLLFDEIEDGLNHEIMEFLMDEIVRSPQQVILTTHSPMILNFLEDEIAKQAVMFIYRDKKSGRTQSCRFFDLPQNKEKLEYMGPGEVFANADLNDLI